MTMATPLHWKSYQFHQYIYGNLYSHIVSMNISNEKFQVEKSWKKLFPFFLATVNLFINLFSSLYIIVKFFVVHRDVPIYMVILHTWFATVLIMINRLNYLSYRYGHDMGEDSLAHLFLFDRKLRNCETKLGYSLNIKWKPALLAAIGKTLKQVPSADRLGLVMIWFAGSIALVPIIWPFFALLFNLDPCVLVLKDLKHILHVSSNEYIRVAVYILRYFTSLWFSIEMSRSFTIYALTIVSIFNIYVSCTHIISSKVPTDSTINEYNQLHCVNQKGEDVLRKYGGIVMWAGFVAGVIGLWGFVMGPKLLPTAFLILVCLITFVTLGIMQQALSRVVECNECSTNLIKNIWLRKGEYYWQSKYGSVDFAKKLFYKIWRKRLRAQRPLVFYYAMASFDRDTKTNYYYKMCDYAVTLILI